MATFLDEERFDEDSLEADESIENLDEQEEEITEEPEQQASPEDDLPEKYRGKSASEIARMHVEAEKALGRQGGEVGELRKIVDDFVKTQLDNKTTRKEAVEEEPLDWFADPDKAMQRAIDNHPKMKQAEQVTLEMAKARALNTLRNKHPDYNDVLQDPSFMEWVQASKVRTRLFMAADQRYDTEAADELLSNWKERKSFSQQAVSQDKVDRKQKVRQASTGSKASSGEGPSRKIYRRADIIKLMQTDPDRYMALADEIQKAYAEKRVR